MRMMAVVLPVGTLAIWLYTGANRGWTKTSVAVEKIDDVTGLEYREYEKRFVPGVDFLAAGLGAGLVAGGLSWLVGLRVKRRSTVD